MHLISLNLYFNPRRQALLDPLITNRHSVVTCTKSQIVKGGDCSNPGRQVPELSQRN